MLYKKLTMNNSEGLNASNAQTLVKTASGFASQIHIEKGNKKVNAKSIMGILSLGIKNKDSLLVFIDGNDEDNAMMAIEDLFDWGF